MKRSFSFWLLCSSLLISSSTFAAEDALLAQANMETSPAPVELKPSDEGVMPLSQPPAEIPPAPVTDAAKPVALPTPPAALPVAEEPKHTHEVPPQLATAGGLTLDAAIQKALNASPRLRSAAASVLASRGERRQAGALPNPEVGVEAENFSGGGSYSGTKSLETTVGVTQLIELGGKRGSRKDIADQGMTLSQLDLEAERLNLIRDVTVAFVDVAAAEERFKIAAELRDLADDVLGEVGKRVSAAREPMIQKNKAEVTRATARIAYETANREIALTKRKLASLWGGTSEVVVLNTGELFKLQEPPASATLEPAAAQNPDLTRWDAALKRSQASYELERANAIPDPRISVGMRDFRDSGDKAFLAGISIPIPVFNANRGNIDKARHTVSKTESDAQTAKLQIGSDLSQRYQEMNIAYQQVESLEHDIIPTAQKSFSLSREGYRAGAFGFLEVLDAQRTLFDAKEQRVAALKNYHVARAEVERLTAKNLQNTVIQEDAHAE